MDYPSAGNWYRFNHEFIIFGTNGASKREFSASELDVWNIGLNETYPLKRMHPSQKPIELVEKMIKNSSHEGEVVMDCFMGSGTTAEACIRNNRHFVGFEIDEKYFDIAQARIAKAYEEREQRLL